jgi:hypothetical protein
MYDLPLGDHLGVTKLKKDVISSFYLPRMATHIEANVSSCEHCQRNKNDTGNTRGIPTPMTTPLRPVTRLLPRLILHVFSLIL